MLTVNRASEEQENRIYKKHLRYPLIFTSFSYDQEDNVGFVTCYSLKLARIEFQMRRDVPIFFSLVIGSTRYDIHYPEGKILKRLTEIGLKEQRNFWKGGEI